jgi:sensor histidine kinase YesM
MCSTLAESLRYVSDYDTSHATLAAEIRHVRGYLELMQFRYEDGLEFTLDHHEDGENIFVPKLILQPVVENCFRHAFADRDPPWRLGMRVSVDHQGWRVEIVDNGKGFGAQARDDILEKVESILKNPSSTIDSLKIGGLGLVNSLVRLKLHYGEQAYFALENQEGGGTKITLGGSR